jgi:hypothetical protein
MPRVGFEPTIPVFERAKTVHCDRLGRKSKVQIEVVDMSRRYLVFTTMREIDGEVIISTVEVMRSPQCSRLYKTRHRGTAMFRPPVKQVLPDVLRKDSGL